MALPEGHPDAFVDYSGGQGGMMTQVEAEAENEAALLDIEADEPEATETETEEPPSEVPFYAYLSTPACETKVEEAFASPDLSIDNEDDKKSFFLQGHNRLLQTEKYRLSGAAPQYPVDEYYNDRINRGLNIPNAFAAVNGIPLNPRGYYDYGGAAGLAGGGGGPVALSVDFLYSPFIEQALLTESFEVAPVLKAGFLPAFRPGDLNQYIVAHPDRYATIRVMSIDKEVIYATTNFMMEGYTKATKESFKVIESTLGNTLQLNKEKFKMFAMKIGVVDAAMPFDWLRNWEDKWEKYMRASVLAKNRWRWYILFGGHMIGGYPLQYSISANANDEPYSSINLDIFVTDDVRLPEMKRMVSEDGLTYFRWGGTVYNPDTMSFENTISEYPTSAKKAETPEDTEYESES